MWTGRGTSVLSRQPACSTARTAYRTRQRLTAEFELVRRPGGRALAGDHRDVVRTAASDPHTPQLLARRRAPGLLARRDREIAGRPLPEPKSDLGGIRLRAEAVAFTQPDAVDVRGVGMRRDAPLYGRALPPR